MFCVCAKSLQSQPRDHPSSLMSPALTNRFFTTSATWGANFSVHAYV